MGLFGRKLVSGVVVDKHYYPAGVQRSDVGQIGTGKQAFLVQVPTGSPTDGWSITVSGVDKNGKPLKKEIYVDGPTYGTIEIGSKWPIEK